MNGHCRYGDTCKYAHGEEITWGITKAMGSIRGSIRGMSANRFVRGAAVGGVGGSSRFGPHVGNPQMNAVGGGIEIDYDER